MKNHRVRSAFVAWFLISLAIVMCNLQDASAAPVAVGGTVEVINTGSLGLHLRDNPGNFARVIATLRNGTRLTVTGGPVQKDGYTWWKITSPAGAGWVVANWISPVAQAPTPPKATPAQPTPAVAAPNKPPIARIDAASGGLRAQEGQELRLTAPQGGEVTVSLSAARSQDPEGKLTQYTWESGGTVVGSGSTLSRSFRPGNYTLTLTVKDAQGAAAQAQVRVVVAAAATQPAPPSAPSLPSAPIPVVHSIAPNPVPALDGYQAVTLTGSGFVSGSQITLRTGSQAFPIPLDRTTPVTSTQIRIQVNVTRLPAQWTAEVTNPGNRISNRLAFNVVAPPPSQATPPVASHAAPAAQNRPPVAHIDARGGGQQAQEGQELRLTVSKGGEVSIILSGARSQDPEGRLAQYVWQSGTTLLGTTPGVTRPFRPGTYAVVLTVKDAQGAQAQAQVRVIVSETAQVTPQPNPQLLAQIKQLQITWQQLSDQANKVSYPTPADKTAITQDLQRAGQTLQAAEMAAQRGDSGTVQTNLTQVQQILSAISPRLTQHGQQSAQQTPGSSSSRANQKQFGDPLEEFKGVRAFSRGECTGNPRGVKSPNKKNLLCEEDFTYQCVDYVKRFYPKIAEVQTEWGTAWKFWERRQYTQLTRFLNRRSTERPQAGDILFFQEVNGNGGHVAIVTEATPNSARVIHQNILRDTALGEIPLTRTASGTYEVAALKGMPGAGWLRVGSGSMAQNQPPLARIDATAGGQRAQEGQELRISVSRGGETQVSLSAARSQDPEGKTLQYIWQSGNQVLGTTKDVARPFKEGTYVITLLVKDAGGLTNQTQVRVVVSSPAQAAPPAAAQQSPQPNAQLLAQVQQVRTAWQQLNDQASKVTYPTPADKTSTAQDLQRAGQNLQAAETAAQRGDSRAVQTNLSQVQQILTVLGPRVTKLVQQTRQAPQGTPSGSKATTTSSPADASRKVLLSQYPLLSQMDPNNYKDPKFAEMEDEFNKKKFRVKYLACAATAYTMLDRGRGNSAARIDQFYRIGPGAVRPPYIGDLVPYDANRIADSLDGGNPVVLHGVGGPLYEHYVLVVGFEKNQGRTTFIALDPWPGNNQIRPGRQITIDAVAKTHPTIGGLVFNSMRLVGSGSTASGPSVQQPLGNKAPIARIDATSGNQRAQEGQELRVSVAPGEKAQVILSAARSQDPNGRLTQYVWQSGENTLGTSPEIVPSFRLGTHTVTLKVTNAQAAQGQAQVRLLVSECTPLTIAVDGMEGNYWSSFLHTPLGDVTPIDLGKGSLKVWDLQIDLPGGLASQVKAKAGSSCVDVAWWDRNPHRTQEAVASLQRLLELHMGRNDKPLNIVAHSWGGVIAYLALSDGGLRIKGGRVGKLVTIGTPLQALAERPPTQLACMTCAAEAAAIGAIQAQVPKAYRGRPIQRPAIVGNWTNFYSRSDDILRLVGIKEIKAAGVINKEVDGGHSDYLEQKEVMNQIRSFAQVSETAGR